eukprot:CAMPEP_0177672954 /NCGR_PEP_ID=MMETSP0447-20121125/25652_1 /TAXON_ID=0 /ORGANISM="Stygamoeba regulata, Strain BSH-02190019" /LENGTH=131 /DNA_ID=CAMNT_0019180727 /DNA_START=71 /DNA_END=465 /DNA_ORIENTATION=-
MTSAESDGASQVATKRNDVAHMPLTVGDGGRKVHAHANKNIVLWLIDIKRAKFLGWARAGATRNRPTAAILTAPFLGLPCMVRLGLALMVVHICGNAQCDGNVFDCALHRVPIESGRRMVTNAREVQGAAD